MDEDEDEDEGEDEVEDEVEGEDEGEVEEHGVGLTRNNDHLKIDYEEFMVLMVQLQRDLGRLCAPEGLTIDDFKSTLESVDKLRRGIQNLLNGPSMLKGVTVHPSEHDMVETGINGLAEEISPLLLHAAFVSRASRKYLADRQTRYPTPPPNIVSCSRGDSVTMAKKGTFIVRMWKKHLAYQAIWAGKKWTSGGFREYLGRATGEDVIGKNPITEISERNIQQLKKQLEATAAWFGKETPRQQKVKQYFLATKARHQSLTNEISNYQRFLSSVDQEDRQRVVDKINDLQAKASKAQDQIHQLKAEFYTRTTSKHDAFGLLPEELNLFAALIDLPYTIKHATNNWYCIANDGRLDSLKEFSHRNPEWKSEFSTTGNVKKLGNHGFVFFRLDVGHDPIDTRYGATLLSADLSLVERDGWISLFDQLKPLSSSSMKRYYDHNGALVRMASTEGTNNHVQVYEYGYAPPREVRVRSGKRQREAQPKRKTNAELRQAQSFSATECKNFNGRRYPKLQRKVNFWEFVFYGPQIRLGLALSLILELRYLHHCGYRKHVLETFETITDTKLRTLFLRQLISQTFRPEAKYPVSLRFTEHPLGELTVQDPAGDGRWMPDGTEGAEMMSKVRFVQSYKSLQEQEAAARRLAGTYEKKCTNLATKYSEANDEENQLTRYGASQQQIAHATQKRDEAFEALGEANKRAEEAARERDRCRDELKARGPRYAEILGVHPFLGPHTSGEGETRFRRGVGRWFVDSGDFTIRPGFLVLDEQRSPCQVAYLDGSRYRVLPRNADGNLFYQCCAEWLPDGSTSRDLRARLSQNVCNQDRQRVATPGQPATVHDIATMARMLGVTIVLHSVDVTSLDVTQQVVGGGDGGPWHFLFYTQMGQQHLQPLEAMVRVHRARSA
ncbi:MAG: hypothetical protein AAGF11_32330 [Myxococcota bacterium]